MIDMTVLVVLAAAVVVIVLFVLYFLRAARREQSFEEVRTLSPFALSASLTHLNER